MKLIFALLVCLPFLGIAQQPELKGGLENFVKENTIYPSYSRKNCIQGTIKVAFRVNKDGQVAGARIDNGFGIDLDEEALRLINMTSGKWSVPTTHDSTTVFIVPVNFILQGYNCERVTKQEITRAIQNYKDQEQLFEVISSYYKSRERGIGRPENEAKIIRLKNELGIDENYLDNRVEAGVKKIKQGDKPGACKEFLFVKYMGSDKADEYLSKYCN